MSTVWGHSRYGVPKGLQRSLFCAYTIDEAKGRRRQGGPDVKRALKAAPVATSCDDLDDHQDDALDRRRRVTSSAEDRLRRTCIVPVCSDLRMLLDARVR